MSNLYEKTNGPPNLHINKSAGVFPLLPRKQVRGGKLEYYTKEEIDARLLDFLEVEERDYTPPETSDPYYTKSEFDTMMLGFFIIETPSAFIDPANTTPYYTKMEIDSMLFNYLEVED
jgi:hypothetical protein